MLILEIRHLQVNIIHTLREPGFYKVLRFEESHLWGEGWIEEGLLKSTAQRCAASLSAKWIPLFPSPADLCNDSGEKASQTFQLLKKVWQGGYWGRDQRRHYHHLSGLQRLKREIFCDKLQICRFALENNLNRPQHQGDPHSLDDSHKRMLRARFIVMRSGALHRAATYIKLLHNYQSAFNKSMDTGVQDHPRPSIERRRELGIYMDFLSERCRDLLRDMQLLLNDLGDSFQYRTTPVIYHRWRHDFTSRTEFMGDEVDEIIYCNPKNPPTSRRFINTSYYMPERPDLQPVIAHEVAHTLIWDRFDNLEGPALTGGGAFADLLATLRGAVQAHRTWPGLPRGDIYINPLIREIACDLLASSMKGYPYLYALFLESIGHGLERLLTARGNRIELNGAYDLTAGPKNSALARQWYLRLRLTTAWLERVHHWKPKGPDQYLLTGVETILDDLSNLLDDLLPPQERKRGRSWQALSENMVEILSQHKATRKVKEWRTKRSRDNSREEPGSKGPRQLPRSMARLDDEVRELLYRIQLKVKTGKNRPLYCYHLAENGKKMETLAEAFNDYYGTGRQPVDMKSRLYRHVYDIPWQCSIMRAIDILGRKSQQDAADHNQAQLLKTLHDDFALGRELFQLALEFHLWDAEPASRRLTTVVRLIEEVINQVDKKELGSDLAQELQSWLSPNADRERVNEDEEKQLSDWLENNVAGALYEWPAKLLTEKQQLVPPTLTQPYRKLEKAAGHALERLCNILTAKGNKLPTLLFPLLSYLHIRSKKVGQNEICKKDFYQTITHSLAPSAGTPSLPKLHSMVIGRLSLAGSYPALRNDKYEGFVKLSEALLGTEKNPDTKMQPLLGRYDMLLWKNTRSLCRCPLPRFSEKSVEVWPTFFIRREMALAVELKTMLKEATGKSPTGEQETGQSATTQQVSDDTEVDTFANELSTCRILAILAVNLQRRTFRLDFLYRLLKTINESNTADVGDYPELLEQAGSLFEPGDFAFLTDGWGDLVIVFVSPNDEAQNQLSRVFRIQNAIYQDFLVDRTELILTPHALDLAVSDRNGIWSVHSQMRLMEDRGLLPSNEQFRKHWRNKESENTLTTFQAKLYRTPGHMDWHMDLVPVEKKSTPQVGFYERLIDMVDTVYLDRIDTCIAEVVEEDPNDAPEQN